MSNAYERIDQDTLRQDSQLNGLLSRIKQDVLKGYIVEVKTRANSSNQIENNSKQSSRFSSMSNSMVKQPMISPNDNKRDLDEIAISPQQQQPIITKTISAHPPKVKSEIVKPVVHDNHVQSEQTHQSFPTDEEPWNLINISKRLDDLEAKAETGDSREHIKLLKVIITQLQRLMAENQDCNLHSYAIQMIRTVCLLTKLYKQIGDFKSAIKQLKIIRKKFIILDPNVTGRIMIELGKLFFLNEQYQDAQKIFFEALLHYEKLQWKSEIAKILLQLAKLHSWMKNFDQSKKLIFGAISILKEFLPEDDEEIAEAYLILGECHYIAKDSEQALEFLGKAVQIKFNKYKTHKHIRFIETYNLLGLVYGLVPDIQQSLYYFVQALQCFQQNCIQRAQILNNIAVIYQSQGINDKATKCHDMALEIYQTFLPDKHSQIQRVKLNQTCLPPM